LIRIFNGIVFAIYTKEGCGIIVKQLNLDSFSSKDIDIEINQYKILSGLKAYRAEFNRNRLYPYLAELVYLSSQLEEILARKPLMSLPLPKGIKNSIKDKNVFVEIVDNPIENKEYYFDLIEWALPKIKELIEEAYVFYNFVEENMIIHEVGMPPIFKNDGFLFINDNSHTVLQIHRFEYSVYSSTVKPFNSLKTSFVEIADALSFEGEEEIVKVNLVKKFGEKPSIATFLCKSEFDFPFDQTIFPIAKRKLLNYLTE
jgi:hypothetical protein